MGKQTGAGQGQHTDKKLDQALEDSFPASDPPATGPRGITGAEAAPASPERVPTETEAECQAESDALDEALDDSFPASDPPAQNVKRGADDAAPEELCPPTPLKR
ncbi:hypothetical protein [Roseixanthobacter glucoisosaccharinicivorans]|uniref:hypothetical protein n=1 Tax=Roseixanthobacter glucoisosaccharinicivorans TaxID=3119923 RepID=UPI0037285CBB